MTKMKTPFFFTFKGLSNTPIFFNTSIFHFIGTFDATNYFGKALSVFKLIQKTLSKKLCNQKKSSRAIYRYRSNEKCGRFLLVSTHNPFRRIIRLLCFLTAFWCINGTRYQTHQALGSSFKIYKSR